MRLLEKQFIFNKKLRKLLDWLDDNDYLFVSGEIMRTEEQAKIYHDKGTGSLTSLHIKKLAIDITLFKKQPDGSYIAVNDKNYYALAGEYWKSLYPDNRWGGNFTTRNDPYHFEMME